MFGINTLKDKVRLLEYENKVLEHRLNDLINQLDDLLPLRDEIPMFPFGRVYVNEQIQPSFKELKRKYR